MVGGGEVTTTVALVLAVVGEVTPVVTPVPDVTVGDVTPVVTPVPTTVADVPVVVTGPGGGELGSNDVLHPPPSSQHASSFQLKLAWQQSWSVSY